MIEARAGRLHLVDGVPIQPGQGEGDRGPVARVPGQAAGVGRGGRPRVALLPVAQVHLILGSRHQVGQRHHDLGVVAFYRLLHRHQRYVGALP